MRRSPTRLLPVVFLVALALGGSPPAEAAESPSWKPLAKVLDWLGSWWDSGDLGRLAEGAGRSRESAPTGPVVARLEREILAEGVGQDPYGRTPPPSGLAAPGDPNETDPDE